MLFKKIYQTLKTLNLNGKKEIVQVGLIQSHKSIKSKAEGKSGRFEV
jgi:hypothetical protein